MQGDSIGLPFVAAEQIGLYKVVIRQCDTVHKEAHVQFVVISRILRFLAS